MPKPVWGPVQHEMETALSATPVDVAGVVAQLAALQSALSQLPPRLEDNSIVSFNTLYLAITSRILRGLKDGEFVDSAFLALLDVEFAKRYVDALRNWTSDQVRTPKCWALLFRRHADPQADRMQSAMAGVNAHINYDLTFAVLATLEQQGVAPGPGAQYQDYLKVNDIFYSEIPGLRRQFLAGNMWNVMFNEFNGHLDDWAQNLLVRSTRELAWRAAERIWPVRADPVASEKHRATLDRNAALLGEACFTKAASLLVDPVVYAQFGKVNMDDTTVGSLSDAIAAVRAELEKALKEGQDQEIQFTVGPVEIEFEVELIKETQGSIGIKVLSGQRSAGNTRSHRVKTTLQPVTRDEKNLKVAGRDTQPAPAR
jgi:Family of unknown function (DUF5995)/Trypsin-co-occurring domain 2